jgi:DedD protein
MATRSDAPDLAVDELRRRARRRLVGAIVLALAAAVLLPLLLESEPKPLGDDVSIQIPPIDNGKFINPLSPAKAPDPKLKSDGGAARNAPVIAAPSPAAEAPAAQPPAGNDAAKTEPSPASGSPAAAPSGPPTVATPAPPAKVAEARIVAPEPKSAAAQQPSEPKADAKPASTADAKSDAPKASGAFVVQVAAFSDRYGARSLMVKLQRGGFPGYTEAVTTDQGTLHRVRVGPYPSREAADAARAKLKAAGFGGMVTRNG